VASPGKLGWAVLVWRVEVGELRYGAASSGRAVRERHGLARLVLFWQSGSGKLRIGWSGSGVAVGVRNGVARPGGFGPVPAVVDGFVVARRSKARFGWRGEAFRGTSGKGTS